MEDSISKVSTLHRVITIPDITTLHTLRLGSSDMALSTNFGLYHTPLVVVAQF